MAARRAVILSALFSALNLVAGFAASLVLARLLTPHDIGVFSIGVVIIGVLGVFRDFGADVYSQQVKDLTPERIGSVLGLTLTSAAVLSFALVLVTPYLESYFAAEGLTSVMHVLLLSFLLIPVTSMMTSLMSRQLQVGTQAKVNLGGALAHATVGVLCASAGLGAAALAWANLANVITGMCIAVACGITLKVWPRLRGWREPARFGFGAMVANLSKVVHQGIPDLLLGRMFGPHEVGLYSRGNGLVNLFQQIVMPVLQFTALPLLSRQHHASQAIDSAVVRGSAYLTVLLWPILAWTAIFAAEIIAFLYGPTWLPAAVVVGPLCVAVAVRMGLHLIQTALVAVGQPYVNAGLQVIALLLRVACIAVARPKDLNSFVMALMVAELLVLPAVVFAGRRWLGLQLRAVAGYHLHSALVSLACVVMLAIVHDYGRTESSFLTILISGSVLVLTWVAAVLVFKHPIREEWFRWRAHRGAAEAPPDAVAAPAPAQPEVRAPDESAASFGVSLVVPTYNRAALIGSTLESALAQTLSFDEIIVVDDGSTDDTEAVVRAFGDRVRYVRTANGGVQAARNLGVSFARSPYVAFCDSDDLLAPDYLATMVLSLKRRPDIPAIYCNFRNFSATRTWADKLAQAPSGWLSGARFEEDLWSDIPDLYRRTLDFQPLFPSGLVMQKAFYARLGGFDPAFKGVGAEDWEFTLRVAEAANVGVMGRPLVSIRRHDGNDSASALHMNLGEARILSHAVTHHAVAHRWRKEILRERRRRLRRAFDAAFAQRNFELAERIRDEPGFQDHRIKAQLKRRILGLPQRLQAAIWTLAVGRPPALGVFEADVVFLAVAEGPGQETAALLRQIEQYGTRFPQARLWLAGAPAVAARLRAEVRSEAVSRLGDLPMAACSDRSLWGAWQAWLSLPKSVRERSRHIIVHGLAPNWVRLLCLLGLGHRTVVVLLEPTNQALQAQLARRGVTFVEA